MATIGVVYKMLIVMVFCVGQRQVRVLSGDIVKQLTLCCTMSCYSSIDPPRSKPCLVNRVRSLSLDNTSSNDECLLENSPPTESRDPTSAVSTAGVVSPAVVTVSVSRDVKHDGKLSTVNSNDNRSGRGQDCGSRHDLLHRVASHFHVSGPASHVFCHHGNCTGLDWTEPIVCASPRLTSNAGKLSLVVDDTRFLVDAELFKMHPETMLGRLGVCNAHKFCAVSLWLACS